jgi:hypothetical protein
VERIFMFSVGLLVSPSISFFLIGLPIAVKISPML